MKKIKSLLIKVSTLGMGVMMLPSQIYAQKWMPGEGYQGTVSELIKTGLNTSIILSSVIAVGYLIFNGVKYMTAAGDTAKTEEAQKGIANALIGLVICIAAVVVVNFVLAKFDVVNKDIE